MNLGPLASKWPRYARRGLQNGLVARPKVATQQITAPFRRPKDFGQFASLLCRKDLKMERIVCILAPDSEENWLKPMIQHL